MARKKEDLLISRSLYLKAGTHIGSRRKNKKMKKFIHKIKADGLAIIDVEKLDERIRIAARFLASAKKPLVVGRKPAVQRPIKKFAEITGFDCVVGRFMPGTLTNPKYEKYMEPDVVLISDPMIDTQAMDEAIKSNIPIVALCDSATDTSDVDFIIPVNNRSRRSLALVFWLLAREILKMKGKIKRNSEFNYTPADFLK